MAQEIVVVAFDKEIRASELLTNLAALEAEHQVDLADAVVVTRDEKGNAHLQQTMDLTAGKGAVWGGLWGLLIGLIFLFPIGGWLLGMGAGAIVGKLTDAGLDDKWIKEVSDSIPGNGSGLFLLVNYVDKDAAIQTLCRYAGEGKIITTTLPDEARQAFQDALTKQGEPAGMSG